MKKVLLGLALAISIGVFSQQAFGCAMSCAAICKYTCEGTPQSETGCSDADYAASLQSCCTAAFNNTPGINNVPCGPGEFN
jgi:hypothetical protein